MDRALYRSFTPVKFPPIFNLIACLFGFHAEIKFSCANSGQLQVGLITNFTSFHFQIQLTYYHGYKVLEHLINIDFFMESGDVRYLRTSLFSQNERARLCERVSFVKTNECVNIVQKHFP